MYALAETDHVLSTGERVHGWTVIAIGEFIEHTTHVRRLLAVSESERELLEKVLDTRP